MFKIITALFILFTTASYSQFFADYNAKEGMTSAANLAADDITNPVLIGLGAANTSKVVPSSPLDVSFNKTNGSSKMWLYYFMSEDDNSKTTFIPIVKSFGSYVDLRSFTSSFELDGIEFPLVALNEGFADSDEFITYLNTNSNYAEHQENYPETDFEYVYLTTNLNEDGTYGDPTWLIVNSDDQNEDVFYCEVNAINGQSECALFTNSINIKYTLKNELKVYPQPANNEIIVSLNDSYNNFRILDILGNEYNLNSQYILDNNLLNVNISNLETGIYFIILENNTKKDVVRFIKN